MGVQVLEIMDGEKGLRRQRNTGAGAYRACRDMDVSGESFSSLRNTPLNSNSLLEAPISLLLRKGYSKEGPHRLYMLWKRSIF